VASGIRGELGVISEGVGYTIPFETLGAEWIDGNRLAAKLDSLKIKGVLWRPLTFKPFYGKHQGKELHGVQIHMTDYSKLNLMSLQFLFLQAHNELYPDKNPFVLADSPRILMFDKVAGTDQVRKLFMQKMSYDDVKEYLNKDVKDFRKKSRKYRLY